MKKLLTLLLLLFSITGYGAGTVVKKIESIRANVRSSEGAGTTTLVYTDAKEQIFNLSAARTIVLPSTGVKKGDKWTIKNISSGGYLASVQPSGSATTIASLGLNQSSEFVALVDTPTAVADWTTKHYNPFSSMVNIPGQNITYDNGGDGTNNCGDLTSASITVTPRSSSSKFKISAAVALRMDGSSGMCAWINLRRGTTPLSSNRWTFGGSGGYDYDTITTVYLDSPSTTSSITYKVCGSLFSACGTSAIVVNQNYQSSHLIVEEIF